MTIDIDAIRNRAYLCAARRHRWASEVGVDDQDVIDDLRRAKELATDDVPALCDEVSRLRAVLDEVAKACDCADSRCPAVIARRALDVKAGA